jgi:hypothetical protein
MSGDGSDRRRPLRACAPGLRPRPGRNEHGALNFNGLATRDPEAARRGGQTTGVSGSSPGRSRASVSPGSQAVFAEPPGEFAGAADRP